MQYKNILLIDDDDEDQEIFITAVRQLSYTVTCNCFNDASEALQKLATKEISPDVIFLDLNMPVMNGQQFLVKIKKNEKLVNIPIIIFTTSSHPGTIQSMKELGAYDFITKPGTFDGLIDILEPLIR